EEEAKVVIHAVLEGLVMMHKKYYVHRDVKPHNLFLFSNDLNTLKLGDFGISAQDNGYSCVGGMKGTKGYMAPEILKKLQYGRPVDMWATGVVAYQLLYGAMPFPETKKRFGVKAKSPLSFPFNFVSEAAQDFIRKLLVEEPSYRLTAEQAMEHSWIA
ncbi:kinase-like domain-containing protein, partial [Chytriomyces sp. MP71]